MALTKTQVAINSAMTAPNLQALDLFEHTIVKDLPQQRQRENVMVAVKARQCQLKGTAAYSVGKTDVDYLRSAMWIGRLSFEVAFVVDLQCDIFKGRYLIAGDGFRFHTVPVGLRLPVGCYHLFDDMAYLLIDDAPATPNFGEAVKFSNRNFMTKARLPKKTNLHKLSYKLPNFDTEFIKVSAGADKMICTGENDADHKDIWQILKTANVIAAATDRDCTVLLDYFTNAPVVIVDSGGRIALLMPCCPNKDRSRERPLDAYHDAYDRRDLLTGIMARFYESMVERAGPHTTIGGCTFNQEGQAMRYYAKSLLEFDPAGLSWYPYTHRTTNHETVCADVFDAICRIMPR